jgi:hypothetical protein
MAYLVKEDFRAASLTWYTQQLALTGAEAPDASFAGAIERARDIIDTFTNDHFEAEPGGGPPEGTLTIDVDASGISLLRMPKRIRSVSSVQTLQDDGTWQTELATTYKVVASLDSTGIARNGNFDALEIVGRRLNGQVVWPDAPAAVRVTGKYSWTVTPGAIRRAAALIVYDIFKPLNDNLRRATRWIVGDHTQYETGRTEPTGMPEVDGILDEYKRFD